MTNELGKQLDTADKPQENDATLDHKIRRRAYQIWMEEGQPAGQDREHWKRAKAEVLSLQP
jgi:hypothetical protein